MFDHDYDRDPIMTKNFLYVGDTVYFNGKEEVVKSIKLIENNALNGTQVVAVPWVAKKNFTVTFDNHWAYGEQLVPKENTHD